MLRAFVLSACEMFEPGAAHGFLASAPVQDVTLPAVVCVRLACGLGSVGEMLRRVFMSCCLFKLLLKPLHRTEPGL